MRHEDAGFGQVFFVRLA